MTALFWFATVVHLLSAANYFRLARKARQQVREAQAPVGQWECQTFVVQFSSEQDEAQRLLSEYETPDVVH